MSFSDDSYSDVEPLIQDTAPIFTTQGERDRSASTFSRAQSADQNNEQNAHSEPITDFERSTLPEQGLFADDELYLLQAQVFIEDATAYRSIDHKVDHRSLKLYRLYHSTLFIWLRFFVILFLHLLAFIEFPSSLTYTSDIRHRAVPYHLPCGITESVEMALLLFLVADLVVKAHIYGHQHLSTNKWMSVEILVLVISLIDWGISLAIGCTEIVRVRRMLRPVFIIQNSSLMKKIINSLRKTMSQILGVLMLMALHLYIFTLFGMLLFPRPQQYHNQTIPDLQNGTDINVDPSMEAEYFATLIDSFMNLLVLLTTANNPDITLPAYRRNRLYALFFIIFLVIGLYCLMNMLTAIIYNQFRGYFLSSMQSSLKRRRLGQRAAFEALKKKSMHMGYPGNGQGESDLTSANKVYVRDLKLIISRASIPQSTKELLFDTICQGFMQDQLMTWNNFHSVLRMMEKKAERRQKPSIRWFRRYPRLVAFQKMICHRYFSYFGNLMAIINVILITIELGTQYDKALSSSTSVLRVINFMFIFYYALEQSLLLVCNGLRRYTYNLHYIADFIIVSILLICELVTVGMYGLPFFTTTTVEGDFTLWNLVRFINILIMFRLVRVIWHIKTMAIVAHTLLDLIKNLQSFGGILVVIYYFYAILGMELFQNVIVYPKNISNSSNITYACGTYEQLEYWANNFDDFAAALVVLWDVMVVNNWFVFLDAYSKYTNKWSYIYFIVWWLISYMLALNLFTALILENFIMKWDRFHDQGQGRNQLERRPREGSLTQSMSYNFRRLTIHDMFSPNLSEPSEEDIVAALNQLRYANPTS